jgi:hypothetical protein
VLPYPGYTTPQSGSLEGGQILCWCKAAMRQYRKTIFVFAVLIAVTFIVALVRSFPNRVGSASSADTAAVDGLPKDATDIHWFLSGALGPNYTYDFKTSKKSFESWVSSFPDLEGPYTGGYAILVYNERTSSFEDHEIEDAIFHTWTEEDRGQYVAYDVSTGRAYYHSHTR